MARPSIAAMVGMGRACTDVWRRTEDWRPVQVCGGARMVCVEAATAAAAAQCALNVVGTWSPYKRHWPAQLAMAGLPYENIGP